MEAYIRQCSELHHAPNLSGALMAIMRDEATGCKLLSSEFVMNDGPDRPCRPIWMVDVEKCASRSMALEAIEIMPAIKGGELNVAVYVRRGLEKEKEMSANEARAVVIQMAKTGRRHEDLCGCYDGAQEGDR